MAAENRPWTGSRLKAARKSAGRTLKSVASEAEISVSYLNLIENNKRTPPPPLVAKLAKLLKVEVDDLAGQEQERLLNELTMIQVRGAQAFPDTVAEKAGQEAFVPDQSTSAEALVDFSPQWGQLIVNQARHIQRLEATNRLLNDRIKADPDLAIKTHQVLTKVTSVRSFAEILRDDDELSSAERTKFSNIISDQSASIGSTLRDLIELFETRATKPTASTPREEVEDFLIDRGNYFPTLELGAEDLRRQYGFATNETIRAVQLESLAEQADQREFVKSDWSRATTRFQLAKQLVNSALKLSIDDILSRQNFLHAESVPRARHALENYAAGSFLYPYDAFLERAQALRYDIDRLADETGGGFEQVAHRLVTLQKPGNEGVQLGFLRVDPAGYVSKRFNLPGLGMPRTGSSCPLWIAHEAFMTLGQTRAQRVVLPSSHEFLLVAKSIEKLSREFLRPQGRFSVMIACRWQDAHKVVYGDMFAGSEALASPVGTSCSVCERAACPQRAEDSLMTLG